jgi:hypothetical protein
LTASKVASASIGSQSSAPASTLSSINRTVTLQQSQ